MNEKGYKPEPEIVLNDDLGGLFVNDQPVASVVQRAARALR